MSGNKPIQLFDSCGFQRNFLLELWPFVTTLHCRHARIKLCLCHIMPFNAVFHAKSTFNSQLTFCNSRQEQSSLRNSSFLTSVWLFPLDNICLSGSSWAKQIPFLDQDNTQWGVILWKHRERIGIRSGSGIAHQIWVRNHTSGGQCRGALWPLLPLPALCSI